MAICPSECSRAPSGWRAGEHRELVSGEGVRSAIQEHPLSAGTEGRLERPEAQSQRKDPGAWVQSRWGWGPGRREILSSKLDRTLTSGTIASAGRGDADFPRALHANPSPPNPATRSLNGPPDTHSVENDG